MKNTNKAFTLVELIVVITILAILGGIAFISLQGYSQDAKNSKVVSDTRSIATVIETKLADGNLKSLRSAVKVVTASTSASGNETDNEAAGTYASGVTLDAADTNPSANGTYDIGKVNFTNLKQNGADFKDSDGKHYIIAIAIKGQDAFYQIAGQTRNLDDTYTAVVKGNYLPLGTGDAKGLISPTGDTT
jgi:prepilin-type N-terminal cleavage/methylation domain-containing protein